jgi:hypothetical protein
MIFCSLSFMEVDKWEDHPSVNVITQHPITYNSDEKDVHKPVNLVRYLTTNAFNKPLHAYNEDRFQIIWHNIVSYKFTNMLMDLSLAHILFQTDLDDFSYVCNDVKYTVYSFAFTRNLGNVQADRFIAPFSRRMNAVDAKLWGEPEECQ